jgi:hypothetical protein
MAAAALTVTVGLLLSGDYLTDSKISFIDKTTLNPVPVKYNFIVKKGVLELKEKTHINAAGLLFNPTLITLVKGGESYSTQVPFTSCLVKSNHLGFNSSNVITTLASVEHIQNNTPLANITASLKQKLGVDSTYDIYKDTYFDESKNHNANAKKINRVVAHNVFLWNRIYKLAQQKNIIVDLVFHMNFWKMCYNFNHQASISDQVNEVFGPGFMPSSDDTFIFTWTRKIFMNSDLIKVLMYKLAPALLSDTDLLFNPDKIKIMLDYCDVKKRFKKCIKKQEKLMESL